MGEIVPFCRDGRRRAEAAPQDGSARSGSAQILFFLGVRYERHDDGPGEPRRRDPAGAAPRRPRRRQRA
jgi:hypothetical protein